MACVTCHKPVWRANWLVMACGNNNVKKNRTQARFMGKCMEWTRHTGQFLAEQPKLTHLFPWLYPQLRRQRFQESEKSTKRYKDLYPPDMGQKQRYRLIQRHFYVLTCTYGVNEVNAGLGWVWFMISRMVNPHFRGLWGVQSRRRARFREVPCHHREVDGNSREVGYINREVASRVLAFVRLRSGGDPASVTRASSEFVPMRQAVMAFSNGPGIMYAGEGSSGAYYGADDKDSAGNSGYTWYPATESVASGSASLSISAPVFPPHPPTSAFLPAGPSTDWPSAHTALSSIPYYPPPAPTPNFWGNDTFLPTAFIHPVFHSYGGRAWQQTSETNPYAAPPPILDDWLLMICSSRASTPFSGATSSTGSWDSWPSTSSSCSSRFSSVDPGDMSEACGLSSLEPEDARRFVDNDTELRFAEDAPGPKVSQASFGDPAPPISAHKRKKVSKKKNNLPTDLGRLEDLDWHPSDTVWLDEGVSSEYVEFPQGLKLTSQKAIFRLERVTGIPSELPHFEIATAFILSIPKGDFPKNMTPDNAFRNLCPHSYESSTGGRSAVDTRVSGFFFGRDPDERIETRRATPKCRGVYVCSAIDKTFVNTPRRALDPELMEKLVQATLRQREQQNDTLVGQVLSFIRAIKKVYCRGVRPDGTRCPGTHTNGKVHGLRCTEAHTPLAPASSHSSNAILVDEALFLKASAGERIVEEADYVLVLYRGVGRQRSRVTGAPLRCLFSGASRRCLPTPRYSNTISDFNHSKDGRPFTAKLELVRCGARITFFCPYEETYGDEKKYGDLVRTMIAFPDPGHCHSHPTALGTKCPSTAREKYKEAARRFGPGGTVAKIENAASTKLIFGTATPGEYNSSLLNTALKNRLLREVRSESSFAGDSAASMMQRKSPVYSFNSSICYTT
ncbi:hypothetical protein B0H16DRAFT_1468613 [Mycena metata]|uniref:Uncharacterized protein n=1 Tax=Mycena metata TaxID=1033252 RepID=A0AAD7I0J7_9AGAR|nr:hypothetical protein B0H16DRAFT_1468613 [Mycena metata]